MFKISKLILTGMLTGFLAFPFATKAEEHPLIGINHPPLPEEVEEIGGWTIEDPYSIKEVFVDGQNLLLLNRLIEIDSRGEPFFQTVNVLSLPLMYKTETIEGGDLCTVNGVEDPNVLIIVELTNTPKLTKVRKAWRVENEKFKEMSIQGKSFACENFGYGL